MAVTLMDGASVLETTLRDGKISRLAVYAGPPDPAT
jgi:hypothetical protein